LGIIKTSEEIVRVVYPQELFAVLNIAEKDFDQASKILKTGYDFLLYMRAGDRLETEFAKFHKVRSDLFQIESTIQPEIVTDSLVKRRIVKFPG